MLTHQIRHGNNVDSVMRNMHTMWIASMSALGEGHLRGISDNPGSGGQVVNKPSRSELYGHGTRGRVRGEQPTNKRRWMKTAQRRPCEKQKLLSLSEPCAGDCLDALCKCTTPMQSWHNYATARNETAALPGAFFPSERSVCVWPMQA